jgi:virginiamycin B lyase
MFGRRLVVVVAAVGLLGLVSGAPVSAGTATSSSSCTGQFSEYLGGSFAPLKPVGLVVGADGNLWFTDSAIDGRSRIGRMSTDGSVLGFHDATTSPNRYATGGITKGPDGAVWFIDTGSESDPQPANLIGRMTTDGSLTEYSTGPNPDDSPQVWSSLVTGADGNLWFPQGATRIAKMTTQGVITSYPTGLPDAIIGRPILGPDGNVWFTYFENQPQSLPRGVAKVAPDGTVTTYPITAPVSAQGLTVGPDGNIWAAARPLIGFTHDLLKITTSGEITVIPITLDTQQGLAGIITAPDGNLWFPSFFPADGNRDGFVRRSLDGTTTDFLKSTPMNYQNEIGTNLVIGPDGNIWFSEGNAIGTVAVTSCPSAPAPTPIAAPANFTG